MSGIFIIIAVAIAFTPITGSMPLKFQPASTAAETLPQTTPTRSQELIGQTTESSTPCLLSVDQVQEIQSHQSDLYYMVVNGEVLVKENPLDLYVELFRVAIQSATTNQLIQDIWVSRTPCKSCIEILQHVFLGSTKPTLHIETWRTGNVRPSYPVMLEGMGCISSLKTAHYSIESWDWEMFSKEVETSSCPHYSIRQNSTQSHEAGYLHRSLPYISGFDTFCN